MATLPISQTRICGDLVFTSGQIGFDTDGSVPAEFGRQVELAIESLRTQLEEAGATLASVAKVTNFVVRRDDVAEMNEIYARYFEAPFPARSTIVTDLVAPEFLFEIEAVAVRS
jgi:2-iminobutanoate/2-iminopropanoate deaminase